MVYIFSFFIKSYQKIKPFFPDACRFYPSCSNYALQALKKYGAYKGVVMALCRILKCSPLSSGGYDPVR